MEDTRKQKEWLHHYAEMVDGQDVQEVLQILQQYAARTLNRRYMEEQGEQKEE